MASPSRLLRTKQSPPLPSQFLPFNSKSCNNLSVRGLTSRSRISEVSASISPDISDRRPHSACPPQSILPATSYEISGESVKDYLRSHKSFLEDYLLSEVPVVALQRILKRKTCRRDSGYEVASTIGDAITKLQTPKSHTMMGAVSSSVQRGLPVKSVLFSLCKSTAEAAYADSFNLYLAKSSFLELINNEEMAIPIRLGDTIPGYVAATKLPININLLKQRADFKFPKGSTLTRQDNTMVFILCVPILTKNNNVVGVLELGRKIREFKFTEEDEEIVRSYLSWATVAMDCSNIHAENEQLRLLFDTFHNITRCAIGEEWNFESIFEIIRCTVCELVNSETAKIFMMNKSETDLCLQLPGSNLYDRIISAESNEAFFAEDSNNQSILSQSDLVFPGLSVIKKIVDYSAQSGEILNLNDLTRRRFISQDMDTILAAENCKSILCAPIAISKKVVLGVIVAINKRNRNEFSAEDEEHFGSFCEFCSLVLSSCKSRREIVKTENKCSVLNEVLQYNREFPLDQYEEIRMKPLPSVDDYPIADFGFDCAPLDSITKAQLAVTLFLDLVDPTNFDRDKLLKFCLTVSKNYRPIPYHNWEHAFSVAHCMYFVIKGVPHMFTEIEKIALFVACLCHDLDHRGVNSPFLAKTGSPLAHLYTNPILENHHFSQTVALLNMESISILSHLSDQDFLTALTVINKAIMASDIMQFFKNRESMVKLTTEGRFSWDNPAHKEVALRMLITMCDLNSTYKPWGIYKVQVDSLFEEFYGQGDREKELGMQPAELMDRDAPHKIADIQMNFIGTFSLSSCQLLEPLMPHIKILQEGAYSNLAQWKNLQSAAEKQWEMDSTKEKTDDSGSES